ncbi:MAG: hypothetical protein F4066_07510 [Chloroflexi bacterium]|nr:hypothetical protein [Chloroflexota bacterium]MYF81249.1 hypothetical protein [Chloroflexota bacterium]MYI04694.1 hypothetical protein [Chloroflexota bacterium]
MPIELAYRAAMERLAELADSNHPPHVSVKAAVKLVDELSPNNSRHAEVMRALNGDTIEAQVVSEPLFEPGQHPYTALLEDGESTDNSDDLESGEADDDPL